MSRLCQTSRRKVKENLSWFAGLCKSRRGRFPVMGTTQLRNGIPSLLISHRESFLYSYPSVTKLFRRNCPWNKGNYDPGDKTARPYNPLRVEWRERSHGGEKLTNFVFLFFFASCSQKNKFPADDGASANSPKPPPLHGLSVPHFSHLTHMSQKK